MTRLILARHGETDWNKAGRYQGHADVPLNQRGLQQAAELSRQFAETDLHAVYSSDLSRALKTAEIIAHPHGLKVRIDPRLREIDQGEWEGLNYEEIKEGFEDEFRKYKNDPLNASPPGGETILSVRNRLLAAVNDIVAENKNQTVLIAAHGFALALLLLHFRNLPIEEIWELIPKNTAITELTL